MKPTHEPQPRQRKGSFNIKYGIVATILCGILFFYGIPKVKELIERPQKERAAQEASRLAQQNEIERIRLEKQAEIEKARLEIEKQKRRDALKDKGTEILNSCNATGVISLTDRQELFYIWKELDPSVSREARTAELAALLKEANERIRVQKEQEQKEREQKQKAEAEERASNLLKQQKEFAFNKRKLDQLKATLERFVSETEKPWREHKAKIFTIELELERERKRPYYYNYVVQERLQQLANDLTFHRQEMSRLKPIADEKIAKRKQEMEELKQILQK
jgi:hypothetical protein